jgi:hypothetical protein
MCVALTSHRRHLFLPLRAANKLSTMLSIMKRLPGGAYTPSAGGAREMYANVQAYKLGQQFQHVDVSGRVGVAEKLLVSVLKDPIAEVQRMLADPAGKAVLRPTLVMDADGQRVYNEMWTADKWMTDQVG